MCKSCGAKEGCYYLPNSMKLDIVELDFYKGKENKMQITLSEPKFKVGDKVTIKFSGREEVGKVVKVANKPVIAVTSVYGTPRIDTKGWFYDVLYETKNYWGAANAHATQLKEDQLTLWKEDEQVKWAKMLEEKGIKVDLTKVTITSVDLQTTPTGDVTMNTNGWFTVKYDESITLKVTKK